MRRRGRIKEVIKTYECIKEKNPENEIVENELKELYLQQAIEGAKRLGPLEKTEEPVVPTPEKHLPPLAEAHLEQVIRMLTRPETEWVGKEPQVVEPPKIEKEITVTKRIPSPPEKTKDSLTGLYDRNSFLMSLEEQIEFAEREKSTLSLIFLDVTHFEAINEKLGERGGDRILRQIAEILKSNIKEKDTLFRHNGDEFVLLCPGLSREESIAKEAQGAPKFLQPRE